MILEVVYLEEERVKATTNGSKAFSLLFNENIVHDLADVSDSGADTEEKVDAIKKDKEKSQAPKKEKTKPEGKKGPSEPSAMKSNVGQVGCWFQHFRIWRFPDPFTCILCHALELACTKSYFTNWTITNVLSTQ
jgi:hypothetical protein